MERLKYTLLMALAAFIWGTAFVAQRLGADILDAYTFNGVRSLIGSLGLLAVVATLGRDGAARQLATRRGRRDLLVGGFVCGLVLTASALFQQLGLGETTAGKAGFITALYILIVPVLGLLLGRRAGLPIWVGAALGIVGMYFLCIREGFTIERGDLMVLRCAFSFACHIMVVDYYARKVDPIFLSQMQFLFAGLFSLAAFPVFHGGPFPPASDIARCALPLLYTAILSSGVAYTLQIIAQKRLEPGIASLVMSLESVFAVLSGWAVLGERLTGREALGCVLVFIAVIIAELKPGEGGCA